MNIAVINIKDLTKFVLRIIVLITIVFLVNQTIIHTDILKIINIEFNKMSEKTYTECLDKTIILLDYTNMKKKLELSNISFISGILGMEMGMVSNIIEKSQLPIEKEELIIEDTSELIENIIPIPTENVKTEAVSEKNIPVSYSNEYDGVQIKNKTDFSLTEEMLIPNIEIINKSDLIIFHTHTCESYTCSEQYNYNMTGNYRTTDLNYTVVRVGEELATELNKKGFKVLHDTTYHDYPAYSGSYSRSLETVQKILKNSQAEIIFDIHRDAVGNSNEYGPTVKINNEYAAQLMFVIGTNGSGLEHPNWVQNLKLAIKIQQKANSIYPGLFRPILLTTLRYNQHVTKGASIIEVGATGNTMEQCLLSMKCLANVIEKIIKEM